MVWSADPLPMLQDCYVLCHGHGAYNGGRTAVHFCALRRASVDSLPASWALGAVGIATNRSSVHRMMSTVLRRAALMTLLAYMMLEPHPSAQQSNLESASSSQSRTPSAPRAFQHPEPMRVFLAVTKDFAKTAATYL